MFEFVSSLFQSDSFMPHGHCYFWNKNLMTLHVLSDGFITLAYYFIPLSMFYIIRKRRDIPYPRIGLMFTAFIFACGTTHLMEVWTVWKPSYWASGVVKAVTAALSVATAIVLLKITPEALKLRGPAELEAANRELEKQIAERLAAEAKFKNLLEFAPDAMVMVDGAGRITMLNQKAEILFGYRREELVGQSVEMLIPERFHAAHKGHRAVFFSDPRSRPMGAGSELWARRKDGIEFPVEISLSPLKAKDNILVTAAIRDVTERRESEKKIMDLNRELIRHASELETANKELETFSYSVSHDLRAPLRAIGGFSKIVMEDHGEKIDAEGRRLLGVIHNSTRNMGQLIDDLLAFSRLSRQEMAQSEINMRELVQSVWEQVSPKNAGNLRFTLGDIPPARGDRALVRQMVFNLLHNAVKYTGKTNEPVIEVGGGTEGRENVYFVRDNGAGFDMNYAQKLFGVFQRLHTADEFEGTGVGLAIVERIVRRHGGRIWAEGKIGEGAVFRFTLPRPGGDNAGNG